MTKPPLSRHDYSGETATPRSRMSGLIVLSVGVLIILLAACNRRDAPQAQRTMELQAATTGNHQAAAAAAEAAKESSFEHGVHFEFWTDVKTRFVYDVTNATRYGRPPSRTEILPSLELQNQFGDFYGVRLSGWIHPPKTGEYRFWIAADDDGEFWLSPDETSERKVVICRTIEYTGPREWDNHPEQASGPVKLQVGKRYYFEALMQQGGGAECFAVAWRGPGIQRQVIAADFIEPTVSR